MGSINARGTLQIGDSDTGYIDWRYGSGDTVEVLDIEVPSEHRRKGRGRRLMQQLFSLHPPHTLVWAITRVENRIAQEFYEAIGFRVVGVLREFYNQNSRMADAIMYGKRT